MVHLCSKVMCTPMLKEDHQLIHSVFLGHCMKSIKTTIFVSTDDAHKQKITTQHAINFHFFMNLPSVFHVYLVTRGGCKI